MAIVFLLMLFAAMQIPFEGQQCTPRSPAACSGEQLLSLLSNEGINQFFPEIDPEGVQSEAARRVATVKLLETLRGSRDDRQREAIVRILSERNDSEEISRTFASLLGKDVDQASCFMADYLATRGDQRALHLLNDHYAEWEGSSLEWASVVRVFGHQRFYPATDNLIESLGAASMNLGQAALETLMMLYPGAQPNEIATIAGSQAYFRRRANSRR